MPPTFRPIEVSYFAVDTAAQPDATARVSRVEGDSFSGHVVDIIPPLSSKQLEVAMALGATILGKPISKPNQKTVLLLSTEQAERHLDPRESTLSGYIDEFLKKVYQDQSTDKE